MRRLKIDLVHNFVFHCLQYDFMYITAHVKIGGEGLSPLSRSHGKGN